MVDVSNKFILRNHSNIKRNASHSPGLGNNPKSQERAFELGENLAGLVGCQVRFMHGWMPGDILSPDSQGGPGTLLSCMQEVEDGFDILDATDYGPYPNIDKVWQTKNQRPDKNKIKTETSQKDLGDDAFLPMPPREILESGQAS